MNAIIIILVIIMRLFVYLPVVVDVVMLSGLHCRLSVYLVPVGAAVRPCNMSNLSVISASPRPGGIATTTKKTTVWTFFGNANFVNCRWMLYSI